MEAVLHDGADVVKVKGFHLSYPPGGVLESCQADVKVNLIQVATVEGVELGEEWLHTSGMRELCFD